MRHTAFGIFEAERRFGFVIAQDSACPIPTRVAGEWHVRTVMCGRIPAAADFLRADQGPAVDGRLAQGAPARSMLIKGTTNSQGGTPLLPFSALFRRKPGRATLYNLAEFLQQRGTMLSLKTH